MTRFLPFGSRSRVIQVNTLGSAVVPVTYATWNPADKGNITLSGGDLIAQANAGTWNSVRSTISKTSGKWYCEFTCGGLAGGGITLGAGTSSANLFDLVGMDANGWGIYGGGPNKFHNGSNVAFGSGGNLVAGDIIQISLDMDGGNIYIGKNGTDFGLMYSGLGSGPMFIMASVYNNGTTATANFGATPFAYPVPVGYNQGLYDTVDLSAGLVAHYPLATNSLDTSGNGYDGVDTNMTYAGGKAVFNNSRITYPLALDWNSTLTINMWVSITANGALISNFHSYWTMLCRVEQTTGTIHWDYCISDGVWYFLETPGGAFTSGTEFMLTFIREANGNRKILVNGVEKVTGGAGTLTQHGADYSVGSHANGGEPIAGSVRKQRLYNRVLNAGEIAALYAEG